LIPLAFSRQTLARSRPVRKKTLRGCVKTKSFLPILLHDYIENASAEFHAQKSTLARFKISCSEVTAFECLWGRRQLQNVPFPAGGSFTAG